MTKLFILFIALASMPVPALAQDMEKTGTTGGAFLERHACSDRICEQVQVAYADADNYSFSKRSAAAAQLKFSAVPGLSSGGGPPAHRETDAIVLWRDRVFNSLSLNMVPHREDPFNIDRELSNEARERNAIERRMAAKIVLKETARYMREQVPEIDRLIEALKLEISNRPSAERSKRDRAEIEELQIGAKTPAAVQLPHILPLPENRLYLKTGLRMPVEGRKINLISESEARYGNVSSFFKVNLDGQFDRSLGLSVVVDAYTYVQAERRDTHSTDPVTGRPLGLRSRLNLIQVVHVF